MADTRGVSMVVDRARSPKLACFVECAINIGWADDVSPLTPAEAQGTRGDQGFTAIQYSVTP
jgi:hypothetical protein